jgi:hypothetical protein
MKLLDKLPANYVEKSRLRGPWVCAVQSPPSFWHAPQVLFADGTTGTATYIPPKEGNRPTAIWWGFCYVKNAQAELSPIGWRDIEKAHSC